MSRVEKRKLKGKRVIYISLVIIALFALGFFGAYKIKSYLAKDIKAENEKVYKETEEEKTKQENKEVIPDKPKEMSSEIIISSVGDCTIGSDEKFGYSQSLPDVISKNGNDLSYIFSNVNHIFKADDITTANLETTFTNSTKKAEKQFTFKAPPSYAKALPLGSIEGVNISNNHIYDYLKQGFSDTLEALKQVDTNYFGEGQQWIKEVKGVKVGFLGYTGYWYDKAYLSKLKKDIESLKAQTDFVIINFHWGDENHYSPNNIQKYIAHYAIDQGADLIVGHHPHVVQGLEKYKGKIIAYSMGNFAFGGNKNPKDKDTFILQVKLKFTNNKLVDYGVKAIPASISSVDHINDYRPTPLTGAKKEALLVKLNKLSFNLGFNINDNFNSVVDAENIK